MNHYFITNVISHNSQQNTCQSFHFFLVKTSESKNLNQMIERCHNLKLTGWGKGDIKHAFAIGKPETFHVWFQLLCPPHMASDFGRRSVDAAAVSIPRSSREKKPLLPSFKWMKDWKRWPWYHISFMFSGVGQCRPVHYFFFATKRRNNVIIKRQWPLASCL